MNCNMEKTFELKGYVCLDEEDVYLEEKPEGEFYYPNVESVGSLTAEHFSELSKGFDVSPGDWTRGTIQMVNNVFCQYFVADKLTTWDEANEYHIKEMAGALQTEDMRTGYSEYTITETWTELFVGGHNLRNELKSHKGKYVIIRIKYKI